jgi:membrane protein DedA with SNARE-associated domain
MAEIFHQIVNWLVETIGSMGYLGIMLLMAIESSFIPFPSEIVMIPAGYLASRSEMNVFAAIFCGIAGSLIGAYINYMIALRLGRPFILQFGKYVGISHEKFLRVDDYFVRHGEITTFIGRLIPGVRQLISFPAGLGRMSIAKFSFFTAMGAGLWVTVLVLLGYWIGENQELIEHYFKEASVLLLLFAAGVVGLYIFIQMRRKKRLAPVMLKEMDDVE